MGVRRYPAQSVPCAHFSSCDIDMLRADRAGSSEAPLLKQTPPESRQGTPEGDQEPLGPRRGRRRPVDYVKLAAAMFGGQEGDR